MYSLIEKLRAARNNLRAINETAIQMCEIADSEEHDAAIKVGRMRELAVAIERAYQSRMNSIDNGGEWGGMSTKEIIKDFARGKKA